MNIADNVQETTTGTSAAVIVLGGAAAGFKSFAAAFDVGATDIPVRMEDDAGNWESSWFTLTNATTLTRTAIADSSNGGAATVFASGAKNVFCTAHVGVFARLARDDSAALSDLGDPAAVSLFVKTAAGIHLIPLSVACITGLQLPASTTVPTDASLPYTKADGTEGRITFANLQAQLGGGTAPIPTVTSVTVSPSAPSVAGGGSQTFTATVAGTNSPAQTVTWTASSGSITSGGVFTAPASTSSAQTVTVTARSTVDTTKTGTATVTVPATGTPTPTVTSVTVSPSTASVSGGATQQFSATVNGTNSPSQGVNWTTSAGSINSSGLFTAPAATSSSQTVTVTATSQQDGTKSGTATVTVAAAAPAGPTLTKAGAARPSGSSTGSANVTTNTADGTLYRLVSANSTETADTVKAANVTQAVTAAGVQPIALTGISGSTLYMHVLHRSAAGLDSTVSSVPLYQYAPRSGVSPKSTVLPSTGTTSGSDMYYTGSAYFNGQYYDVTPTPASFVGGWGDSATTPPPIITVQQNTAAGGKNNGMVPLAAATAPAWSMSTRFLWQVPAGVRKGPLFYWAQIDDAPAFRISDSAGTYIEATG